MMNPIVAASPLTCRCISTSYNVKPNFVFSIVSFLVIVIHLWTSRSMCSVDFSHLVLWWSATTEKLIKCVDSWQVVEFRSFTMMFRCVDTRMCRSCGRWWGDQKWSYRTSAKGARDCCGGYRLGRIEHLPLISWFLIERVWQQTWAGFSWY